MIRSGWSPVPRVPVLLPVWALLLYHPKLRTLITRFLVRSFASFGGFSFITLTIYFVLLLLLDFLTWAPTGLIPIQIQIQIQIQIPTSPIDIIPS